MWLLSNQSLAEKNQRIKEMHSDYANKMEEARLQIVRIADKNLKRIEEMEGLRCVFSFIKWKSYVLILVMISFGIVIRHSSLPLQDIGIIYLTIGLSLIFSSIRYFRFFLKSE